VVSLIESRLHFQGVLNVKQLLDFPVIKIVSSEIVPMQFLPIFRAQSEWGPGSSRVTKLAKVQYCENNCNHVQIFASLQQAVFAHIAARQKQYLAYTPL
jgi:hypothetical protein